MGVNWFVVRVNDESGLWDEAVLQIAVDNVNDSPEFLMELIDGPTGERDKEYTGSIATLARDPDVDDVMQFSKIDGPAWLVVSGDGSLSGVPGNLDTGLNLFTVQVEDLAGASAQAKLQINVVRKNSPPTFTADPIIRPDASVGALYTSSIASSATDPDRDEALTFRKVAGPIWLDVLSDGRIEGLPEELDLGPNDFVVQVTDSVGASAEAVLKLTVVRINQPPYFLQDLITDTAYAGVAYEGSLAGRAVDPDAGDTISYSAMPQKPSSWVKVDSDGRLSGTPRANTKPGTIFTLTVVVTDSTGATGTATLNITVLK